MFFNKSHNLLTRSKFRTWVLVFLLFLTFLPGDSVIAHEETQIINQINRAVNIEANYLNTSFPLNRSNWSNDINATSSFGPRLKASENFRYDFHRGIDFRGKYGTPIYAIADGIVRLASINQTHEQRDDDSIDDIYTSTVIQLKHNNTEFNQKEGHIAGGLAGLQFLLSVN